MPPRSCLCFWSTCDRTTVVCQCHKLAQKFSITANGSECSLCRTVKPKGTKNVLQVYLAPIHSYFSPLHACNSQSQICKCVCMHVCSVVSILWDSMDYSLPSSSVHVIFQERIMEWVAISISRESSQSRY